jgi:uncharacterized protein YbbK (DUF523 family)
MICPVCQLELSTERRESEVVLTYNVQHWIERCQDRDRDSAALCRELRPTILTLVTEGKVTSIEAAKERSPGS